MILDVDGVIVGGKKGYNWPSPHPDVIAALKNLRRQGMIISLCTGKGTFAIRDIVLDARLDNIHIGDGGAVVVDFIHDRIIQKYTIDKDVVQQVIKSYQQRKIYIELYTVDGYYIQEDQVSDITQKHTAILYRNPTIVSSLQSEAEHLEVIKIMPVARDENEKKIVDEIFKPYESILSLQVGVHPSAYPLQFGLITRQNISKKEAAKRISRTTGIDLSQMLGVGDGMTDWQFMDICGYASAMGNGSDELKQLVKKKGEKGFVAPSVDENGILAAFRHFNILNK